MSKKVSAVRHETQRAKIQKTPHQSARVNLHGEFLPTFSAERNIGTALRETFRAFARAVSANQLSLGLSLSMWFALRTLWEEDGLSQAELSRRMEVAPAAVVGIVNSLEAAGYVERRRSDADKRLYRIYLTKRGRHLRKEATARALQVDAKALRGVSVKQIGAVLEVLTKLRRNLAREE